MGGEIDLALKLGNGQPFAGERGTIFGEAVGALLDVIGDRVVGCFAESRGCLGVGHGDRGEPDGAASDWSPLNQVPALIREHIDTLITDR